jgi:CheY-like chemotaxis protein
MKSQNSKTPGLIERSLRRHSAHPVQYAMFASGMQVDEVGFRSYLTDDAVSSCSLGRSDDDIIDFLEEEGEDQSAQTAMIPWKILIADDDSNVHETTLLALSGVKIHGRPLEFLHAYSAKEARTLIESTPDVALVLLDVVMETVDAGLKLVSAIRNEMGKSNLRIVLRTGQPGYAPEKQVNHDFAIDGYTTKSKLTRSILISVLSDTLSGSKASGGLAN